MQIFDKTRGNQKPIAFKVIDHNYLCLWDARDLPKVYKWAEKIRASHDEKLILEFFDLMNRKWDDRRTNLAIEPHQVSKKDDVLTYKGLAKLCRQMSGQDGNPFTHVAIGSSGLTTTFVPFNDALVSEDAAVSIVDTGFLDAAGMSLRWGGTFGESMASDTYNESLVRNRSSASDPDKIVMCINNFNDDPISHTTGTTGFTAAGSIEFTIIMD